MLGIPLGTTLLAISLLSTPAKYGLPSLLLLATVVFGGAFSLSGLLLHPSTLLRGALSIAAAAVVLAHLHEQLGVPDSLLSFGSAVLVCATLIWAATRATRSSSGIPWKLALGTGLLALVTLSFGFFASDVFRWHILRHNKILGTPLYYVLLPRVDGIVEDLFREHVDPTLAATRPESPPNREESAKHDVVLVLVDTLRADALSHYGADEVRMPKLEELADDAWVFSDVLANAPWTRPSVASIFTGLRPEQHAVHSFQDRLHPDVSTLAEAFQDRGYDTAAFVTNIAVVNRKSGLDQGFSTFRELSEKPYARADRALERVETFLAERRRQGAARPLFLYVHLMDPHTPYLSGSHLEPSWVGTMRREYDLELSFLDRHLASFLTGLGNDPEGGPVVLLTSDHGEEFHEHGEVGHVFSLYPEVLRIPLLVFGLGVSGSSDAALEGRDLYDLALDLSQDRRLNLGEWARRRSRDARYASVFARFELAPHRAFKRYVALRGRYTTEWAYLWSAYGDTEELYHLSSDPLLLDNIAPRHDDLVRSSSEAIEAATMGWRSRTRVSGRTDDLERLEALGYVEN